MKTYVRVALLLTVLAIFVCIGLLSAAQKRSTINAVTPADSGPDLQLFLNGNPTGSAANLLPLKAALNAIYVTHKQKSSVLGNLASGALPVTDRVIFIPDDQMSMLQFLNVAVAVNDSFDFDSYRQLVLYLGPGCSGNSNKDPANIFLTNNPVTANSTNQVSDPCWVEISTPKSSARLVKSYRVSRTSVEVNADGSYLLNEQIQGLPPLVSPDANWSVHSNRMLDSVKIKQRPIDAASLDKEVAAWAERRIAENNKEWEKIDAGIAKEFGASAVEDHGPVEMPIIVNSKATLSSVEPILRSLPRSKVKLTFVLNNSAP